MIQRGFLRGQLVFETPVAWMDPGNAVARIGIDHATAMVAGELDMLELEFPDCPPEDRFFRIGTNPAWMVSPISLELSKGTSDAPTD